MRKNFWGSPAIATFKLKGTFDVLNYFPSNSWKQKKGIGKRQKSGSKQLKSDFLNTQSNLKKVLAKNKIVRKKYSFFTSHQIFVHISKINGHYTILYHWYT